jgi:hypothetical protein
VRSLRGNGGHADCARHTGALGGTIRWRDQACQFFQHEHRCVIVDRVQEIGEFGSVPRTGKVEPKAFQRNLPRRDDLVADAVSSISKAVPIGRIVWSPSLQTMMTPDSEPISKPSSTSSNVNITSVAFTTLARRFVVFGLAGKGMIFAAGIGGHRCSGQAAQICVGSRCCQLGQNQSCATNC